MYKYLTRRIIRRMNRSEMDYFAVKKRYKRHLVLQRNIKIVCHESGAEKLRYINSICALHYSRPAS